MASRETFFNFNHISGMENIYDVIVIGAGAIGLSAGYWATKLGHTTLILEQDSCFNEKSSSCGSSRMWRLIHDKEEHARLALEAKTCWEELEEQAHKDLGYSKEEKLLWPHDLLWLGDTRDNSGRKEGNLEKISAIAKKLDIAHDMLTSEELERILGLKNIPPSIFALRARAVDQQQHAGAGLINVTMLKDVLKGLIEKQQGEIRCGETVTGLKLNADNICVTTSKGTFVGRKLIMAAGLHTNTILSQLNFRLKYKIWEMIVAYFKPSATGSANNTLWKSSCPKQSEADIGSHSAYPMSDWERPNHIRISCTEPQRIVSDLKEASLTADPLALGSLSKWIQTHCPDIDSTPQDPKICRAAIAEGQNFVLDLLPRSVGEGHQNVAVFVAGWAMKFAPLFGRLLIEKVLHGQTRYEDLIKDMKILEDEESRPNLLQA